MATILTCQLDNPEWGIELWRIAVTCARHLASATGTTRHDRNRNSADPNSGAPGAGRGPSRPGGRGPPVDKDKSLAPRAVAPRAVAPRAVAPRAVAPRAVAPRFVAPRFVAPRRERDRRGRPRCKSQAQRLNRLKLACCALPTSASSSSQQHGGASLVAFLPGLVSRLSPAYATTGRWSRQLAPLLDFGDRCSSSASAAVTYCPRRNCRQPRRPSQSGD